LDAAFVLADEDKSGRVDVFEFIKLFNLIRDGKVAGLGKKSFLGLGSKSKQAQQVKSALSDAGKPFEAGASVKWLDADDDIPRGTLGKVLCCHDDGDVEVLFRSSVSGADAVFTFGAGCLQKAVPPAPRKDDGSGAQDTKVGGGGGGGSGRSRSSSTPGPVATAAPTATAAKSALELSAEELRGRFAKACAAEGAEDLSQASFKVRKVVCGRGVREGRRGLHARALPRQLDARMLPRGDHRHFKK
jgi:hypothetical protein